MRRIEMVNLYDQYLKIKDQVDTAMQEVIRTTAFINGPAVRQFESELAAYLDCRHVIGCANGTDALQIALMALDLQPGDEVITPGFSYAALAEVILLLKLKPVFIEVDPATFNIDTAAIEKAITPKTRAIAPVHLYGQCANMEPILDIARRHNLFVIEDTAQAIGGRYTFSDGTIRRAGTIGHIGTTSFFPSKNLGCYGDGGAIFTNDDQLAEKIRMIANHGQRVKYRHEVVGVNSRLDTLQAAILSVKLKYLDEYCRARQEVALAYDNAFADMPEIETPAVAPFSDHVYHQYTLKLKIVPRDEFQQKMKDRGIPTMVYYPIPLHRQAAYQANVSLPICENLCENVVSLPISTEMDSEQIEYIVNSVKEIISNK